MLPQMYDLLEFDLISDSIDRGQNLVKVIQLLYSLNGTKKKQRIYIKKKPIGRKKKFLTEIGLCISLELSLT